MNRNLLGWLTLCLCLFLGITFAHATPVEYTEVKTLPLQRYLHTIMDWHVTAYVDVRAKDWDLGIGSESGPPAAPKLCFWHDRTKKGPLCHEIADSDGRGFDEIEDISLRKIVGGPNPVHGLWVVASRSYPSGYSFSISIWAYRSIHRTFENILPDAFVGMTGDFALKPVFGDALGLFILSEAIAGDPEATRFGPHRHRVQIFQYRDEDERYRLVGEYITDATYEFNLMDDDPGSLIEREAKRIRELIVIKDK